MQFPPQGLGEKNAINQTNINHDKPENVQSGDRRGGEIKGKQGGRKEKSTDEKLKMCQGTEKREAEEVG